MERQKDRKRERQKESRTTVGHLGKSEATTKQFHATPNNSVHPLIILGHLKKPKPSQFLRCIYLSTETFKGF